VKILVLKVLIGLDIILAVACKILIEFLGWMHRVLDAALGYLRSKLEK